MKKTLWIGAGLLSAVLVAGTAWAAHGGMRGFRHHMIEQRIEDALDYIDATPQQRATVEQSKETILKALQSQPRPAHGQIIDILTADQLDTGKLYDIANQHAQNIQAMAKVIVPEIQKIHDALTPAQRAKLAAKAKQMRERHMQGGFGGPPEE